GARGHPRSAGGDPGRAHAPSGRARLPRAPARRGAPACGGRARRASRIGRACPKMPLPADVSGGGDADARLVEGRGSKIVIAVALFALLGAFVAPTARSGKANTRVTLTALESGVLSQLNQIRLQHGLQPVKISAPLTAAAAQHSRDMGSAGYFQHESRDGTAFWRRIGRWYGSTGYGYWSV